MTGPFQKGEVKVFRLASGITPDGDENQFSSMDAPSEWCDDVLCDLFQRCISSETKISHKLTSLPTLESDSPTSYSIDLGAKATPSHDAVYGTWTACEPSKSSEKAKNILLSSSDDEKNNDHNESGKESWYQEEKSIEKTSKTKKEKISYSSDEIADLCQAWYQAGKCLGFYLTKNA